VRPRIALQLTQVNLDRGCRLKNALSTLPGEHLMTAPRTALTQARGLALLIAAACAAPAYAGSAEDIITAEKCNKCHTASTTKKGPSWASLATKYKGNAEAPARLAKQLKTGGKVGDEDDHKKVTASDADIKAIVDIVLNSK
jgi:cytochrome c